MKYKKTFCLLFLPFFISAQEVPSLEKNLEIKAGIGDYLVNLNYEQPIGNSVIWDIGASVNSFYLKAFTNDDTKPDINFGLTSNFKYIYNRKKRESKGKSLENNAGNYIKAGVYYKARSDRYIPNIMWGTKSNIDKDFSFFAEVGLGSHYSYDGMFIPLNIGFTYSIPVFKK